MQHRLYTNSNVSIPPGTNIKTRYNKQHISKKFRLLKQRREVLSGSEYTQVVKKQII